MSEPEPEGDYLADVLAIPVPQDEQARPGTAAARTRARTRSIQALQLRVAGYSLSQISQALHCSIGIVESLIERALTRAEKSQGEIVRRGRELENHRLDRLQSAYWRRAIEGDLRAAGLVSAISERRIRLNGLAAPTQINLTTGIRAEMELALAELERTIIEGEVVGDDEDADT